MEDALRVLGKDTELSLESSLNPCCNGRCSASIKIMVRSLKEKNSLNPCCNGRCSARFKKEKV